MIKTLCIFSSQYPPYDHSGRNRMACLQAEYFDRKKGFHLFVFSTKRKDASGLKERIARVKRIDVNLEEKLTDPLYQLFDRKAEKELLAKIKKDAPDAMLFHDIIEIPASFIFALKKRKIPVFIHLHNFYPFCPYYHFFRYSPCKKGLCNGLHNIKECVCCFKEYYFKGYNLNSDEIRKLIEFIKLRRKYLCMVYWLADELLSSSEFAGNIYRKALKRPLTVINCGIDTAKILKKKRKKRMVFAFIGAIDELKGVAVAAKAFSSIKSKNVRR